MLQIDEKVFIEGLEAEKARRDFLCFLDFVKLQEPPTPSNSAGSAVVPFQKWPHLIQGANLLTTSLLIVALKARQIGWSWLVAAYVVWYASYHSAALIFLFSRGEYEAKQLLAKCKTVYRNLPDTLRVPLVNGQGKEGTDLEIEFRNGSRIHAFASTRDTGRSETASIVVYDEADFHEWLDANYAATKPTVDAGGQMIMLSTANKRTMLSLFKGLFRGAPGNGWAKVFFGWQARPGRDQAWYERTKASVPSTEGMSPELYMEQEYPGIEEEALAPSRALAYFDGQALTDMLGDCQEPREVLRGLVSIWRRPVVAGRYVLFADTAWGKTGSFSCAAVIDYASVEQVAELHGRPHPNDMAQEVYDLHILYNHAYMGLERAGEGQERDGEAVVVVDKVLELLKLCGSKCNDKMFYADYNAPKPSKVGWQTDGKTRPLMLGELAEAVRNRQMIIRSRAGVGELMTFIRNDKGRPQATEGAYDDRVMTYAGLWQMRKYAKFTAVPTKAVSYPSFAGGR